MLASALSRHPVEPASGHVPLTQPLSWHCPKALYMYNPSFVLLYLPWTSCLPVAMPEPAARTHAVQPPPMRHVQSIGDSRSAHLKNGRVSVPRPGRCAACTCPAGGPWGRTARAPAAAGTCSSSSFSTRHQPGQSNFRGTTYAEDAVQDCGQADSRPSLCGSSIVGMRRCLPEQPMAVQPQCSSQHVTASWKPAPQPCPNAWPGQASTCMP